MIMGLTGGIASGKSTVSALLVSKGARLIDADAIAREIMLPGHEVLASVAEAFGAGVLQPDGTLNRSKLGDIVFHDPEALKTLNGLTHPVIRRITRERMEAFEREDASRLTVVDIPLLYETEQEDMFEKILVVYVPRKVQISRLITRNGLTEEQARARLDSQMDIELKREKADYVIDNSGDLAGTERQIEQLLDRLGFTC
ncbi:dephospho-CoA kinase [Paenibacillus sp. HN-1]|uniref:dephospho-CoA kinase n=1 Tax=Paenibacillus TaxID=44249 RepID=UPI001CA9C714|nr:MULTISPECIES: dephospho-CoA kinase [Paenibacillus]MBY9080320.1 dephospho-CoA kinase [Paenibacillus sp. CGMCC 1.18879]MBY9083021.1 dephospho-CoA kinase [Paenibacillus sinensis]